MSDESDISDAVLRSLSEGDGGAYQRNRTYAKAAPDGYVTKLPPEQEAAFQQWVQANRVPFDPSPTADYDMRGYWQALQSGDPVAAQSVNPNDGQMHFPDVWKTPYHQSFSNESKYATPDAPRWVNDHQLADKSGKVIFDERAR